MAHGGLPIPDGPLGEEAFPEGASVHVIGGQYRDARGVVIAKDPDLRPGSVWVRLTDGRQVLVPGYRLSPDAP
ncbi:MULTISPECIES: hypothetical protein [Amycolatopsis]|uniref:DUF1918 domain-containing protein n=1 Tax=Amycolatopsis tolypomycina TaxID=208445 RepID=A0A1H4U4L9_9PSEU|nr:MULTISPECIES: hypothetical protein [Amycolatopsis]MDS0134679.1 hypothetical protein [Amycolatopsis sp. 505]MDS0147422.1 hypothetical protein [Amycolatopsis sp. CM201R]SEC63676.1 hypothetical protein SAMN04489727_4492 [Amycolatopsis tolypomycina]